jgi:chromosome segregation ATPase
MKRLKEWVSLFRDEISLLYLLGPLSLLLTSLFAAQAELERNSELIFAGAAGLFLAARGRLRGAVYGLALLVLVSLLRHILFVKAHALQLGLEASVGFAILIAALACEEGDAFLSSLRQKIGAGENTIRNLEDEIRRCQERATEEQIAASDRLAALTQSMEEIQSDSSALQILNDVLRKAAAKATGEKERLAEVALQSERKAGELLSLVDELSSDLKRLKDESGLAQQNEALRRELNQIRTQEMQTRLINETLARLHASEAAQVAALEQQKGELDGELVRVQGLFAQSKADLERSERERTALHRDLERYQEREKEVACVLQEQRELAERLQQVEAEAERTRKEQGADLAAEKEHLLAQLAELRTHLAAQAKTEALYRQLREQFEQKTRLLEQTRAQLFHVDTQLQTLQKEKEDRQLEGGEVLAPLHKELERLEQESNHLAEENTFLQDLVTQLMGESAGAKKKVKKRRPVEQESLF